MKGTTSRRRRRNLLAQLGLDPARDAALIDELGLDTEQDVLDAIEQHREWDAELVADFLGHEISANSEEFPSGQQSDRRRREATRSDKPLQTEGFASSTEPGYESDVPASTHPEWLTKQEVAAMTKLSTRTIERKVATGELEVKRVGRLVRFEYAKVVAFMTATGSTLACYATRGFGVFPCWLQHDLGMHDHDRWVSVNTTLQAVLGAVIG